MIFAGALVRAKGLPVNWPPSHHLLLAGGLPRPLHRLAAVPAAVRERVWHLPGTADMQDVGVREAIATSALRERTLQARVVTIEGQRVAGLGGRFHAAVWLPRESLDVPRIHSPRYWTANGRTDRRPMPEVLHDAIWPCDWQHLARHRADVLLTQVPPAAWPEGMVAIDELARAMGVSLIVCAPPTPLGPPHCDAGVQVRVVNPGECVDLGGRRWLAEAS